MAVLIASSATGCGDDTDDPAALCGRLVVVETDLSSNVPAQIVDAVDELADAAPSELDDDFDAVQASYRAMSEPDSDVPQTETGDLIMEGLGAPRDRLNRYLDEHCDSDARLP